MGLGCYRDVAWCNCAYSWPEAALSPELSVEGCVYLLGLV